MHRLTHRSAARGPLTRSDQVRYVPGVNARTKREHGRGAFQQKHTIWTSSTPSPRRGRPLPASHHCVSRVQRRQPRGDCTVGCASPRSIQRRLRLSMTSDYHRPVVGSGCARRRGERVDKQHRTSGVLATVRTMDRNTRRYAEAAASHPGRLLKRSACYPGQATPSVASGERPCTAATLT